MTVHGFITYSPVYIAIRVALAAASEASGGFSIQRRNKANGGIIKMFMPKQFKSAIYAQLFREGVLVVKDKPLDMHPDLEGIPNLNVLATMKSLQSRGYVKKQFNWSHSYYFLNNEGIVFLRNYLHLAQEIVPKTLINASGRRAQLGHPRNVPAGSRLQTKSTISHGRDNLYRVSHKE